MRTPSVVVLDYGSGNLHSVTRALAAAGADVVISADAALAARADGLVVPGVGAFAACMAGLCHVGGPDLIRLRLAEHRPVFGICIGHQVMFQAGVEHGVFTEGVGVLPGLVEQLVCSRLPHMGWNTVAAPAHSVLFDTVADQRFYFVHSYAVHHQPDFPADARITWCTHEQDTFVAAVEHGSLCSTQFHPEKSGQAGVRLLRNWISRLGQ